MSEKTIAEAARIAATTTMPARGGYVALAAQLSTGKTTPREYLETCLTRIEGLDGAVGAFVHLDPEGARRAADAATERWRAGRPLSPIDGMPVGIKDVIETRDMPTGQGSALWEGWQSGRDAACVHALRHAGALILGKTATAEFATSTPWPGTHNPHDTSRTPGGSSSGSGAAVGAGMIPAALGTQVVGSILRPASYNGCVGFKPTLGALNRGGSYDYLSQSCLGPLAATLADAWAVARAIADAAGGDPGHTALAGTVDFAATKRPRRLAVLETGGWANASAGARAAFAAALDKLAASGVEIRSRADDAEIEAVECAIADALPLTRDLNAFECRWPLGAYADIDASKMSAMIRERMVRAFELTNADYADLLARRAASRAVFEKAAAGFDAFVALAATGAAPVGLASTGDTSMNVAASQLGVPALSLPVLSDENLPLGLQLLAGAGRDSGLFGVAAWALREPLGRGDLVGA